MAARESDVAVVMELDGRVTPTLGRADGGRPPLLRDPDHKPGQLVSLLDPIRRDEQIRPPRAEPRMPVP